MKAKLNSLILVVGCLISPIAWAQQAADELFDLTLEELQHLQISIASKNEEDLGQAASVVSIISKDELTRFGAITLRDVLERVPSLNGAIAQLTDVYGLTSRGDALKINSGHILILINGRPAREVQEGSVNSDILAAFPVNILERVEVIRGPGSVLYGSGAFSGVINLVTLEAQEEQAAFTLTGNHEGALGVNGHYASTIKKVSFLAGGRLFDKGDRNVWYTTANFANPENESTDYVSLKDQARSGYLGVSYEKLNVMVSYNEYEAVNYFRQSARLGESTTWAKLFSNIGYQLSPTDKWDLDLNFTHTKSSFATGENIGISRNSHDGVIEFTNHWRLKDRSRLLVGGLYNYNDGREFNQGVNAYNTDLYRGSLALYTQLDHQWWDDLKFTGGIQANKVADQSVNVVPRLGLIWNPLQFVNLKALYSEAYRAPSLNEIGIDAPDLLGDPNLNPEMIRALDVGINYQTEHWVLGVNYFNNLLTDIIIIESNAYKNFSEVRFTGLEVASIYKPSYRLFVRGSILYQENEDQEGLANTSQVAPYGAKLGFNLLITDQLMIDFFNFYQGPLGDYFMSQRNPEYQAYHLLNGRVQYQVSQLLGAEKLKTFLFLQVENILDEQVWLYPSGQGRNGATYPYNVGRSFYLGLRVGF